MDFIEEITEIENRAGKVIVVANNKGGTGKTSLCYAIAVNAFEQGKRVLIIDMDKQGSLGQLFNTYGNDQKYCKHRLAEMYKNMRNTEKAAREAPLVVCTGESPNSSAEIAIILGNADLYDTFDLVEQKYNMTEYDREDINEVKQQLVSDTNQNMFSDFEKIINFYRREFDYIVIDTTPVLDNVKCCRHALGVSDCIVLAVDKFQAIGETDITMKAIMRYSRRNPNILFALTMYTKDDIRFANGFDEMCRLKGLPACIKPVSAKIIKKGNNAKRVLGHDERRNTWYRFMLKVLSENMCKSGIPQQKDMEVNLYYSLTAENRAAVDDMCKEIMLKTCKGAVRDLCNEEAWNEKWLLLREYIKLMREFQTKGMKIERKDKVEFKFSGKPVVKIDMEAVNRRVLLEREALRNG